MILELNYETVERLLDGIKQEYTMTSSGGIQIKEVAEGFQFVTKPEYADYLEKLKKVPGSPPFAGRS